MKITREQLRLWCAGYDDERVAALVPEAGLTTLEFSELDIPAEYRLRALLREEVVPARDLRLLACGWAESACVKTGWNDQRSLEAIAVARRFAVGEATEDELAAAETAARAARGAAAASGAWAASAAAWSAALVDEAASWAAWSASRSAEESACAEQLADVARVLRKIEGGTQE